MEVYSWESQSMMDFPSPRLPQGCKMWKMRILFFAGAGTEFVNIPKSSGNWSFLIASNDVRLWQRLR
jgi:hypothetical protein